MRISSFLTFIVFCFLLFMEEEDEQEKAGTHLLAQLRALRDLLNKLQRDIVKRKVPKDDLKGALERIKNVVNAIDEDIAKLAGQGGMIGIDIDVKKPINKVQASISTFFRSANDPKVELNKLLYDIQTIFYDEIQPEVDEVIYSSY